MVQREVPPRPPFTRGHSCDFPHTALRVRNQEGSGLTIRIPRASGDRSSSPPGGGTSPPPIPRYAQLTTSRYAHMAPSPHTHQSPVPVPKSKSLSTSIDKLSSQHHQGIPSSCSRGSTPSSGRSSGGTSNKAPSRRSPAAGPLQRHKHPSEGAIEQSDSPCGSEISLNSAVSSTASVKSMPSVRSSSSASGRSTDLPRTTQPLSTITRTPEKKAPIRRSSTTSSLRSSRSSTPPENKSSPGHPKLSPGPTPKASSGLSTKSTESPINGQTKVKSPIVGTHRKNAVSGRLVGCSTPTTSSPTNTLSLKRRVVNSVSSSSVSSSSTQATGPRKTSSPAGGATHATRKGLPIFNSYMSLFQVQEKLKKGEVIEGVLRINPKNYEDAFISAPVILGRGDGHLYWRGT